MVVVVVAVVAVVAIMVAVVCNGIAAGGANGDGISVATIGASSL